VNANLKMLATTLPLAAAMMLYAHHAIPADTVLAQNGAQNYGDKPGSDPSAAKAGQKAGTEMDDAAITTKVKTALIKDPEIKSLKISVGTENGNVTLNGKAKNDTQIARAVEIASATKGVKTVTNNLAVGD